MSEGKQGTLKNPKWVPGRWFAVIALSSAALVDSMEGFGYEILWPYMYRSLGLGMSMLAPVLSVGRFIGTITTPIWGAIADRYSRK
jgi:Na+/melibiose symporter-like transporter